MKPLDSPQVPDSEHAETSPHEERTSRISFKSARARTVFRIAVVAVCLGLLVTVYVLAHKNFSGGESTTATIAVPNAAPEVEVLDGAGSMRWAQHATDVIRANGFDVVEMKRYSGGIAERSFIMDRSGNISAARALAEKAGIAPDKVFQKIDRSLYVDMTIVIGKDFPKLKAFHESSERKLH
jgi:hypothetical protein